MCVVTDSFRDLTLRYPRFQLDFWLILGLIGQQIPTGKPVLIYTPDFVTIRTCENVTI